jgi:hypothetical protein
MSVCETVKGALMKNLIRRTSKEPLGFIAALFAAAVLALPTPTLAGTTDHSACEAAKSSTRSISGIRVQFKVEAITPQSFYMGEVWVPSIRGAQAGREFSVEARAVGLDAGGKEVKISPEWETSDPDMVKISGNGARVRLTVLKPGQSEVTLTCMGISRILPVEARQDGEIMRVEIR